MHVLSLQIGQPQTYGDPNATTARDGPWETGFFKEPVVGEVAVGVEGLAGDGQADRRVHGGPDKAVCCYSSDHFAFWLETLQLTMAPGAFGENVTLAECDEAAVCVGDIWQAGDAVLQVSQPRQPCWKLARRWGVKQLTALVQQTGKTGWYCRVLTPGTLVAPATWSRIERPHPDWTMKPAMMSCIATRRMLAKHWLWPRCQNWPSRGSIRYNNVCSAWRESTRPGACANMSQPTYVPARSLAHFGAGAQHQQR